MLVIVNDQPCGSERSYNPLRLAVALAKREDVDLRLVEGTRRSTLEKLADWTLWSDRILVF